MFSFFFFLFLEIVGSVSGNLNSFTDTQTHISSVLLSIGTLPYMPPEALACQRSYVVRPAHDVWSLGIVLFVLVTGDFPWLKAKPSDEEYSAWVSGELTSCRPWTNFAPALLRLFQGLLHPDPLERMTPQDARRELNQPWFLHRRAHSRSHNNYDHKPSTTTTCARTQPYNNKQQQQQHARGGGGGGGSDGGVFRRRDRDHGASLATEAQLEVRMPASAAAAAAATAAAGNARRVDSIETLMGHLGLRKALPLMDTDSGSCTSLDSRDSRDSRSSFSS